MPIRTPSLTWAGGYTVNKLQTNQRPLEADNGEYYIPFIIRWSAYQLGGGAYSSIGFDIGSISGRKPNLDFIRCLMVDNTRNPLGIIITFPDTYYEIYAGPGQGPTVFPVFSNQKTFAVFMQPQDIYTGLPMPTAAQTLIIASNGNIPPIRETRANPGATYREAALGLAANADVNLITLTDDSAACLNFVEMNYTCNMPVLASAAAYLKINGQADLSKAIVGYVANNGAAAIQVQANIVRYQPARPDIFFKTLDLHLVVSGGIAGGIIVNYGWHYISGLGEIPP